MFRLICYPENKKVQIVIRSLLVVYYFPNTPDSSETARIVYATPSGHEVNVRFIGKLQSPTPDCLINYLLSLVKP